MEETPQIQPPRRIGLRGCLIGCAGLVGLLVVLVLVGFSVYEKRGASGVARKLAEIRARGEPVSAEELEAMYVLPKGAVDTATFG